MSSRLKMVGKLLDKYILPKYYDIMEYQLTPKDGDIEIVFWMDGTEEEIEEQIVDECYSILSVVRPPQHKFIYNFTTNGEDFYTYT